MAKVNDTITVVISSNKTLDLDMMSNKSYISTGGTKYELTNNGDGTYSGTYTL